MLELFLLRHGEISQKNCYIGTTDVGISDIGKQQLKRQRMLLSAFDFDAIFCSPLKRCTQTYSLLELGENAVLDKRIREINFGNWEEMRFDDIAESYPSEIKKWSENSENFIFPNGEAIIDFQARVIEFCEYLKTIAASKVLIISHGGVIRHMICYLLNLPLENYLYFKVKYGHLTTIELFSKGGVLTALNKGL